MIDLGFAALLALISAGFGKRILDGLACSPEHPLDALALAHAAGHGAHRPGDARPGRAWLAQLGRSVGHAGRADRAGNRRVVQPVSRDAGLVQTRVRTRSRTSLSLFFAFCLGLVLVGTALTALTPVTDGDALCYHLQVPKVFLMRGSVGFEPDLHETVYPLVTEMLYAVALEFRGPVACRGIQWVLGLVFAANVTALARPSLGRRAWWAGAIALRCRRCPTACRPRSTTSPWPPSARRPSSPGFGSTNGPAVKAAIVAGLLAGLAIGVKYPALVLCGLLAPAIALRVVDRPIVARRRRRRPRWLALAAIYLATALAAGGCWYLRAYVHTGNPVYPFFRHVFGGAGLDEVLDPDQAAAGGHSVQPAVRTRAAVAPAGSVRQLFAPVRPGLSPVLAGGLALPCAPASAGLVGLAYAFLMICLTQRQSMRFLLIALGPMSIAVAYLASVWCKRRTVPARLLIAILLAVMGFEASLAVARSRHVLARVARARVGRRVSRAARADVHRRAMGRSQPAAERPVDRSGPPRVLHSPRLHDGAGPSSADRAWAAW